MSSQEATARVEDAPAATRIVDPRAVRVGTSPHSAHAGVEAIVIEPPDLPLASAARIAGPGVLGGMATGVAAIVDPPDKKNGVVFVDGAPVQVRLGRVDDIHGLLVESTDDGETRTRVLLMPLGRVTGPSTGVLRREVVVDGWRIEVEIESEPRASLRERARRGREEIGHGGPTQVRAIIPGRIVSVSIVPGDPVEAGQQLLVVEAMKMQNELRAPRDGIVSSVAVGVGGTIEVGDILLVLE